MFHAVSVLLLLSSASLATAECPNACSGHGECGNNDQCSCYNNFMGADCSQRVCPFGLAFVDTPRGDLNHNGRVDTTDLVNVDFANTAQYEQFATGGANDPADQEAHFYAECSGKGSCDRELGVCDCFDGYTGSSCQRTTCPNDCSGNGVCRTVREIAAGALNYEKISSERGANHYTGVSEPFVYNLWDADKNQACVCDPGFSGPDCSLRQCPRGADPMSHRPADCGGVDCREEVQEVYFYCANGGECDTGSQAITYHLSFVDWTMQEWVSQGIVVDFHSDSQASIKAKVEAALEAMPNDVFEDVTVDDAVQSQTLNGGDRGFGVRVSFNTNPGNVSQLQLKLNPSLLNQMTGAPISTLGVTSDVATRRNVVETINDGNDEEVTCSNRGLCDYETGLCKCFRGYYHDDCSVQSALAM